MCHGVTNAYAERDANIDAHFDDDSLADVDEYGYGHSDAYRDRDADHHSITYSDAPNQSHATTDSDGQPAVVRVGPWARFPCAHINEFASFNRPARDIA